MNRRDHRPWLTALRRAETPIRWLSDAQRASRSAAADPDYWAEIEVQWNEAVGLPPPFMTPLADIDDLWPGARLWLWHEVPDQLWLQAHPTVPAHLFVAVGTTLPSLRAACARLMAAPADAVPLGSRLLEAATAIAAGVDGTAAQAEAAMSWLTRGAATGTDRQMRELLVPTGVAAQFAASRCVSLERAGRFEELVDFAGPALAVLDELAPRTEPTNARHNAAAVAFHRACALTRERRHAEAIDGYTGALGRVEEDTYGFYAHRPLCLYNRACERAITGEHEEALRDLEHAVLLEASFVDAAATDDYFDGLRGDPRFAAIVAGSRGAPSLTGPLAPIADVLLRASEVLPPHRLGARLAMAFSPPPTIPKDPEPGTLEAAAARVASMVHGEAGPPPPPPFAPEIEGLDAALAVWDRTVRIKAPGDHHFMDVTLFTLGSRRLLDVLADLDQALARA